jgi:hypothetical protein
LLTRDADQRLLERFRHKTPARYVVPRQRERDHGVAQRSEKRLACVLRVEPFTGFWQQRHSQLIVATSWFLNLDESSRRC